MNHVVSDLKPLAASCLLAIVLAGCGGTVGFRGAPGAPTTPGPPNQTASPLPAGIDPMTALSERPLRLPALAANATCVATASTDLGAVAPNYGWGLGPVYLSGQDAWYANGQVAVLMVDARYTGPLLVRGRDLRNQDASTLTLADWALDNAPTTDKERQHGVAVVPAVHAPGGGLFLEAVAPSSFWRAWFGRLSTAGPGCFGLQVDGDVFTEFIVFPVHPGQPPPG